jgi:hypothetical protein
VDTGGPVAVESSFTRLAAGDTTSDGLGAVVQLGGDWDGDGAAELWLYDDGDAIAVYPGGPAMRAGFDPAEDVAVSYLWSATTDPTALRRVGDWDGDGVGEMLSWADSGAGAMSLFSSTVHSGSENYKDGRIGSAVGSTTDGNSAAGQGIASGGGDVDGDGVDDILLGDPGYDGDAGAAWLYLGH